MENFASNYMKSYEGLALWVKVLLCLLWDIPSNLYRFSRSFLGKNTLGMVVAVLLAIFGGWILFIIDIITLVLKEKIYCLEDFSDNNTNSDSNN